MFQHDPDGELLEYVLDLRALTPIAAPNLSPIREEEDDKDGSKTFELETPERKQPDIKRTLLISGLMTRTTP